MFDEKKPRVRKSRDTVPLNRVIKCLTKILTSSISTNSVTTFMYVIVEATSDAGGLAGIGGAGLVAPEGVRSAAP
jgi:hypothetical protein